MNQVVIYEVQTGQILQVLTTRKKELKIDLSLMANHYRKAPENLSYVYVNANRFIDIRNERVINGEITQQTGAIISPQEDIEEYFEDITIGGPVVEKTKTKRLHRRVGIITPWKQQCGIAEYSEDLANNLLNDVIVFCEKDDDVTGSKIKAIPCYGRDDKTYGELINSIIKNDVDVVHVQYNHGLMNAGELKNFGDQLRAKGIYTVMTLHSSKGGVEVFANHFDKIIVHSLASKKDLTDCGVKDDKLALIRIGSNSIENMPKINIARRKKKFDLKRPIVSTFGFLLPQKGVIEAIKAINVLKKKYPDILLIACCAIHKVQNNERSLQYFNECTDLIHKLGLQDNVEIITDFLPFEEVYEYLCASNVVSLAYTTSAQQATSSAGRTALASLRPVICSKVEIFDDLEGVVPKVRPRDYEELAVQIDELLSDKNKCKKIIENITRFLQETSWKNIAKEHSLVYRAFGDVNFHIEGQVFSYFSASIVNRRLACALENLGVNVSLSSVGMAENEAYELGDNSRYLISKPRTRKYCARHQYPAKFSGIDADVKIAYIPVETTSVPDKVGCEDENQNWIESINKYVDYVWTYTSHGKKVLEECGCQKPVYVMPCGYDSNQFDPNKTKFIDFSQIPDSYTKDTIDINNKTFIFMFCGHAQKRKNFDVILDSYLMEFSWKDNVVFIIKSYDGGEVHKLIQNKISEVSHRRGISVQELPRHLYIYEDTPPEKIPNFYYTADCMIQCSRAEGFGLPILEAMAVGTPSIYTPWGGPLDFANEANCFPVNYTLVESDYHVQSSSRKSLWAEVSTDDLRCTMRYVFTHPEEVREKGKNGIKDMKFWSSDWCAFPVIEFIRDIEERG